MKIQFFEAKNEQWYWHLVSDNGKIIADGGEGYDSKGNVKRAAERFVSFFIEPPIIEDRPVDD
jgi:uncharacterized protein YegP (UPF0339 family)